MLNALNDVTGVEPKPRVFNQCGRAFVLTDPEVVKVELNAKMERHQSELPKLHETKAELDKKRTEIEKNLREMVGMFKRDVQAA